MKLWMHFDNKDTDNDDNRDVIYFYKLTWFGIDKTIEDHQIP